MKAKLDTVILFVDDVKRLTIFYTNVFEFDIIEKTGSEWVLLNSGECNIGLHKTGKEYLKMVGAKHHSNIKIVFETDDIHALRDTLLLQKIPIQEIKTFDNYNYWICDGADPEGNIFQLKQKK